MFKTPPIYYKLTFPLKTTENCPALDISHQGEFTARQEEAKTLLENQLQENIIKQSKLYKMHADITMEDREEELKIDKVLKLDKGR